VLSVKPTHPSSGPPPNYTVIKKSTLRRPGPRPPPARQKSRPRMSRCTRPYILKSLISRISIACVVRAAARVRAVGRAIRKGGVVFVHVQTDRIDAQCTCPVCHARGLALSTLPRAVPAAPANHPRLHRHLRFTAHRLQPQAFAHDVTPAAATGIGASARTARQRDATAKHRPRAASRYGSPTRPQPTTRGIIDIYASRRIDYNACALYHARRRAGHRCVGTENRLPQVVAPWHATERCCR